MKTIISIPLILCFFIAGNLSMQTQKSSRVVVFGSVWEKTCENRETATDWKYVVTNDKEYLSVMAKFKASLEKQYPGAKAVVESSKFKFGPGVTHMAIIEWVGGSQKCKTKVVSVHYGKSEDEARAHAIRQHKEYGNKAEYGLEEIAL